MRVFGVVKFIVFDDHKFFVRNAVFVQNMLYSILILMQS